MVVRDEILSVLTRFAKELTRQLLLRDGLSRVRTRGRAGDAGEFCSSGAKKNLILFHRRLKKILTSFDVTRVCVRMSHYCKSARKFGCVRSALTQKQAVTLSLEFLHVPRSETHSK